MSYDFTGKWDEISKRGHGAGRFRVCPDHLLDMFISFSIAGDREFTLEFLRGCVHADEIPIFENIDIRLAEIKGLHSLTLRLTDRGLTDLFSNICSDLAVASSLAESAEGSINIFLVRLSRWAELLRRRRSDELSFNERLGLLGELCMLVWSIENCGVDAALAIRGWRGPEGDTNDIGLNNVRIEVKAQLSTQRQSLKISSLDQLDLDGRNLFIAVNRFCPSDAGVCLKSLIAAVSSKLGVYSHWLMEFNRKLTVARYDPDACYVNEIFRLEELKIYRVDEGFPRLVRSNVQVGICNVNYEIESAKISNFLVPSSELQAIINA